MRFEASSGMIIGLDLEAIVGAGAGEGVIIREGVFCLFFELLFTFFCSGSGSFSNSSISF